MFAQILLFIVVAEILLKPGEHKPEPTFEGKSVAKKQLKLALAG